VGEEFFDVDPLAPPHHPDDQPVVVSANVEDCQILHRIRRRIGTADVLKVRPVGAFRRIEPGLQRGAGVGMLRRFLKKPALC